MSQEMEIEVKIAKEAKALDSGILKWGTPSIYTCPECHGVLLQRDEGIGTRFRCHTGHAYSANSLLAEFSIRTEKTLWSAIRSLEEDILFMKSLAQQSAEEQNSVTSESWLKKADEVQNRINLVRKALAHGQPRSSTHKAETIENPLATK